MGRRLQLFGEGRTGVKRYLMRSLTSQLIVLMLLTLLLSQVLFFLIISDERERSLRNVRQDEVITRTLAIARLVRTTNPAVHSQVTDAASTSLVRYWLSSAPTGNTELWKQAARSRILQAPPSLLAAGGHQSEAPLPNPRISEADLPPTTPSSWVAIPPNTSGQSAYILDLDSWGGFGMRTEVYPDLWLEAVYARPEASTALTWKYYALLGISATLVLLIATIVARRVSRPLKRLTVAAERLGRGEEIEPVPEQGADDIRHTAEAFNRMQSRLHRFVEDRTKMIAAISHDLRTPITSLRLRAEFINDAETKVKIIETLDEMQAMTEATLAFSQDASTAEQARTVDIDALVESLCEDLTELGLKVTFVEGDRVPWRCRPDALRRALRNVIENAVRYGTRAYVKLEQTSSGLNIIVEDEGPGMLESEFENVFAPFVRLEISRNRDTGGVGLGLSIARSILRSHGGDIQLSNRPTGGLRVTLSLPNA
jgi:signal transduction histidine kinase